jgi:hypothetical protein
MSSQSHLLGFGIVGLALLPAPPALSAEYLTLEAAQHAVFPEADSFIPVALRLDAAQKMLLAARAGPQTGHGRLQVFLARQGDHVIGHFFVDEVIGRQDLITYALGIDSGGGLRAPEILSYRESHGGEVRGRAWRQQFASRKGLDQLGFGTDIKNIAGATLSSEHLTQGIRWLTALWELALRPGSST